MTWHRCTEISEPESEQVLIAMKVDDDWQYWVMLDCPYGWNVLCRNEAYWTMIDSPGELK